jgi:hypothetical protein
MDNERLAKNMRYLSQLIQTLPQGAKKREAVALYRKYREERKYAY